MDIEKIIKNYRYPHNQENVDKILRGNFNDDSDYLAAIGVGGTISSGYSPGLETIIPLPSSPARVAIDEMQRFGINQDKVTSIDLFAKDSRDITDEDIYFLLDFISTVKNRTALITCGTYMLPKIAYIVHRCANYQNKIIGFTGSMLPAGFTGSDAAANVISTLSIINMNKAKNNYGLVFASFHGSYAEGEELLKMDLHPPSSSDLVFVYPQTSIPASTNPAIAAQTPKPNNVPPR